MVKTSLAILIWSDQLKKEKKNVEGTLFEEISEVIHCRIVLWECERCSIIHRAIETGRFACHAFYHHSCGRENKHIRLAVGEVPGGVSLGDVNFGFWSHLRCSGQNAITSSRKPKPSAIILNFFGCVSRTLKKLSAILLVILKLTTPNQGGEGRGEEGAPPQGVTSLVFYN